MNKVGQYNQRKLQHFLPGEVVFQIRHPAMRPEENPRTIIMQALVNFLQPPGEDKQQEVSKESPPGFAWKNKLALPNAEKIVTLRRPGGDGPMFSLVPVPLAGFDTSKDMDEQGVLSLLRDVYASMENASLDLNNDIRIQSISPNWLTSSLHHGPPTGGPGSWPLEAPAPQNEQHRFLLDSPINSLLTPELQAISKKQPRVAILDTAPSAQELARAYHERPGHQIIETMLGPNGKLTVHHASQATLYELMHFSPASHQYWMADHGTFVAGIIHTIAPDVELHLYEVLGPYGVGTFTSVAQGLVDAISDLGTSHPLIINCSFMFDVADASAFGLEIPPTLSGILLQSIKDVFAWVTGFGSEKVSVIAAAGNDANPGRSRPLACYPAALDQVVGVGALPKGYTRTQNGYITASYSNISDKPSTDGYVAFGGEYGAGAGVLGVYIGDFPEQAGCLSLLWRILSWNAGKLPDPETFTRNRVRYRANRTGWAWWAGTSFAAPIIAGALANGSLPPNVPQPGVDSPRGPFITNAKENVILVKQG